MNDRTDKNEPRRSPPTPIDRLADDARVEEFPRTAGCAVESARENIHRWLEHNEIPVSRLAKMIGVSPGTLHDVLAGRYKSKPGPILQKAEAAIGEWHRRRKAPKAEGFVLTRIAREIFAVVRVTSKHRGIGVFTGPSGVGKTKALEAIVQSDFPNAVLVTADPGCMNPLYFMRAVVRAERSRGAAFSANPPRIYHGWEFTRVADAFNAAVDLLGGSGRLIIVDEADNLSNKVLSVVRQLHDATGCPVILAGRPPLHAILTRTMRDARIGGSLVGRVCVEHHLEPRANEPGRGDRWLFTVSEIVQMLNAYKVTYMPDAGRWLTDLANITGLDGQREAGALRYALKVWEMAITLHQGQTLTADMLREANTLLRGPAWAAQVDLTIKNSVSQAKVAG